MDRLTTGRRHVRAGSIHVTELINKQVLRADDTVDGPLSLDTIGDRFDPSTAVPASRHRADSKGMQLAKLTSIGAATLVLCGAVVMATTISQERAEERAAQRPTLHITGDQALLPDQLDRSLSPGELPVAPPPAAEPAQETEPGRGPLPEPGTPNPAPPSESVPTPLAAPAPGPAPGSAPPVPPRVSDLELVRGFYALLPNDPGSAFDLLSPDLLTSTFEEFLDSWSTVTEVEVQDLHERQDGVLAVVRMALTDGGALRVKQLLTVADSPRRIVGAQLLSAQRT
ncbi:hypothetical protein [Actinophytocola xanthii]|uniref:Uncharacterized protein n=1 Tax=Actinophytocola xanthii TaxID=1912961 RepID=A0A1Q8CDN7_9PSEU|nr:hypothetical protein [Actinophytocola xanthii]OLF12449.1 hypothetical protein BU204_29125 [Actinophytocola xanthii]